MKVLVTGVTGFIGGAFLAKTSADCHFSLRAALRTNVPLPTPGIECVRVQGLTATADWSKALQGCDAVVHAAARVHIMHDASSDPLAAFRMINVQGTLKLARQAAAARVKRFIFISSIKVNGESTPSGHSFTADDPPAPLDPYGVSKYEAENVLREVMKKTGMEVVIVRPPLVYGPGVKANFFKLLQLIDKRVPLPLGSVNNRRSMVSLTNLVSAITLCIEHPKAGGETFLVSDGEDLSTPELINKLASAMGRKALLLPIPPTLLKNMFSLAGKGAECKRLTDSLCVDSSKLHNILDWRPPATVDQGIQETVDWYLTHG